jgi:hypothetical protein
MKNTITICLLICFLSISSIYSQENWIEIGKSNISDETFYINSTYISNENSVVKIWIKTITVKEIIKSKNNSKSKKKIKTEKKFLYDFDCANNKIRILYGIFYNSSGEVTDKYNPDEYEIPWEIVIPDSLGEYLLNKSCELYNF